MVNITDLKYTGIDEVLIRPNKIIVCLPTQTLCARLGLVSWICVFFCFSFQIIIMLLHILQIETFDTLTQSSFTFYHHKMSLLFSLYTFWNIVSIY